MITLILYDVMLVKLVFSSTLCCVLYKLPIPLFILRMFGPIPREDATNFTEVGALADVEPKEANEYFLYEFLINITFLDKLAVTTFVNVLARMSQDLALI